MKDSRGEVLFELPPEAGGMRTVGGPSQWGHDRLFWGTCMNDVWLLAPVALAFYLIASIRILKDFERGVVFRLGRVLPAAKGPGLALVFAPVECLVRTSLRIEALEVPVQDVVMRDNATAKVSAVIFFRVVDPLLAVAGVADYLYLTSQLAQTTLRTVLGELELDELLSQRAKVNLRLQSILNDRTAAWGVQIAAVEVKQVQLTERMIRVIGRQAEAERERRTKVIHAEGELFAAEKLAIGAELTHRQRAASQLSYLQTLVDLVAKHDASVALPLPVDLIASVTHGSNGSNGAAYPALLPRTAGKRAPGRSNGAGTET